MRNLKRNVAVTATTAVIATMGVGGVVAAQAGTAPDSSSVQESDAGETEGAEDVSDGPDQGPDVNASEPGHQDADETGEAEGAEGAEGAEDVSDGPDQGPDANASEPGHQDADETGESN